MNTYELQIGRIQAVLYAAEEVATKAKRLGDRDTEIMAKETAYEHIKGIVNEPGWCPWAE